MKSDGEIAGIVIGIFILVILLIFLYCKRDSIHRWFCATDDHENKPINQKKQTKQQGPVWLIKRCEQDNQTVKDAENQIIKKTKLHKSKPWSQDLDNGQTPVLVFCVFASRIGTDIESALKGLQNHRPVLVVLHCINKSSLRGDLSDDDYLLDQALRDRVTGIAHFAFSDFEGFYSCHQNEDGHRMLSDHITKFEMSLSLP